MADIFLSLAILARDPEGAATLERALRSALERPDGPMCDEIVILFGGRPHERCHEITMRLADEFPSVAWQWLDLPADIPVTEEGGLADFAASRNYLYSKCRGAWVAYIDGDDVVPSADAAAAKTNGSKAPALTMKAFLRSLPPAFNSVTFAYHYAHDHLGNVIVESSREWVRWRDGFTWINRAPGHHEAIFPVYPNKRNLAELKGFYISHLPTDDTSARRVRRNDALLDAAKFLEASVQGGTTDRWGVQHYLARQAERRNLYALAVQHGEECAALARNDEEKYASLHGLARVLRYQGKYVESMSAALIAYNIGPLRGEAIGDMIAVNLELGDPVRAAEWYGRLLALPPTTGQVGIEFNAYEVDLWPHIAASRAFLALQLCDSAVTAAERAVKFAPYDVGAQNAKKDAVAGRDLQRARDAARFLLGFASKRDEVKRVRGLAENLPYMLEHDPEVLGIMARVENANPPDTPVTSTAMRLLAEIQKAERRTVVPYGTSPEGEVGRQAVYTPTRLFDELNYPIACSIERLERIPSDDTDPYRNGFILADYDYTERKNGPKVVFFCPEFMEPWGPFSPERTGIGGSEEMVILVSRFLAREGASVTVYGPVDDLVVDRNIVWRPFQTFDPEAHCDILISHRTAHLARREKLGAKVHYAWLHDAVVTRMAEDYQEARRSRIKAYLTLSTWQEEEYHARYGIPREQMLRVPNAPEPDDVVAGVYDAQYVRWPHRAVYASAPYRGLNILLAAWPLVRERVPDAELHVCNDWLVHDQLAKVYPELSRLKEVILANKDAPGLVWRGRLTAQALRHEFQSANLFVYPSTFMETSCRAAIRAMACGCLPIYRPLAALEETIGPLGKAVPGDPGQPEYLQLYAKAVAEAMIQPPTNEERRALSEDVIARHNPWNVWRVIAGLEKTVEVGG